MVKGKQRGLVFDALQDLERQLNADFAPKVRGRGKRLPLRITIVPVAYDELLEKLLAGEGDFVASPLLVTEAAAQRVAFTDWFFDEAQVLVVTRSGDVLGEGPDALSGRTLHLRASSGAWQLRLARNVALEAEGRAPTMAPNHHGLEGAPYGLVVTALTKRCLDEVFSQLVVLAATPAAACEGVSVLFPRLPGNKLRFDSTATMPIDLSGEVFPSFPEGARFNFSSSADGALSSRSFRLVTPTGVNVVRVSLSDALQSRWDVVVDAASPAFTLPAVPGTLRDRLFTNGNGASGARSELVVQALRMTQDPSVVGSPPVTFSDYAELNAANAGRTTDLLTAFSTLDYGSPQIAFTTPATTPVTISRGSMLVLAVKGFSIGTGAANDGVVRLSFVGGTGCPEAVLSTEPPVAGSGTLGHPLPTACTGAAVTIRAELLKTDGATPLSPPVARTITATIQ